jgi:hypothetical protein
LRTLIGNSDIKTNNISVSDTNLINRYTTSPINLSSYNPNDYIHSYYVSRFFTAGPQGYLVSGIEDIFSSDYYSSFNIKIVDASGKDYIDLNTNRRKYKILLEPYKTEENLIKSEIPYKIIVCFDATPTNNLKLIYDKFETDEEGSLELISLSFSEQINSVPFYKEKSEEAMVIDPNYSSSKNYAIKKINKKYSDIYKENYGSNGYQVFVPKKAIMDNRSFEVFNWRLIAKSKQSVNLDLINYGIISEDSNDFKQKTVNVCVLYDSNDTQSLANINPYVFYRLGMSSFNFAKLTFANSNSIETDKTKASYWMQDIQNIESLKDYDIVTFSPTKVLSEKTKTILVDYLKNHSGTVFADASKYPSGEYFIDSDIYINTINTQVVDLYYEYNTLSKILDEDKNGAWNIDSTIFEKDSYGIFGKKSDSYRKFNENNDDISILSVGTSQQNTAPIAIHSEYPSFGDSLSQGNLVVTSFEVLHYCNAIYNAAGDGSLVDSNIGETCFTENTSGIFSSVLEGPFKFLYNTVACALYGRANYSKQKDFRSLIYNFVGEWNSSWVMDQDALLEDEKIEHFTNVATGGTSPQYAVDLIKQFGSVLEYYKKVLYEVMPSYHRDKISLINFDNVEFFIEVTNPDVDLTNSARIESANTLEESIPSAYYLFKVSSKDLKCYAYTNKKSALLSVPEEFGPYIIKESMTIKSSDTKLINNKITPVNEFKAYPFNLSTNYNYIFSTEKPTQFSGSLSTNLKLVYKGKYDRLVKSKRLGYVKRNFTRQEVDGKEKYLIRDSYVVSGEASKINCTNMRSSIDSNLYTDNPRDAEQPYNSFNYTGDIDLGNSTTWWTTSYAKTTHRYVKFIQVVLKSAGFYGVSDYKKYPVDGQFGNFTGDAVRGFQQKMKSLGYRVIYEDRSVDSETKSLMQHWIVNLKNNPLDSKNINIYELWRAKAREYGVLDFWDTASRQTSLSNVNSGGDYKKISFTGFDGPKTISDVIYFSIPDGYETLKKVIIDFGAWKNVEVLSYGYSNVDSSGLKLTKTQRLQKYNTARIDKKPNAQGIVEIEINKPTNVSNHLFFFVRTFGQINTSKYGAAEGYSISSIKAEVQAFPTTVPAEYGERDTFKSVNYTETYEAIDSLTTPPDQGDSTRGLDPSEYYASNRLVFDKAIGKLQSNLLNHKVFTRRDRKYYNWSGSEWIEVLPFNSTSEFIEEHWSYIETDDVVITAYADTQENFVGLSPANDVVINYDSENLNSKNISINNISYYYPYSNNPSIVTENFTSPKNIQSGSYTTSLGVTIDFSQRPQSVEIYGSNPVSISSLRTDKKTTIENPLDVVGISFSNQTFSGEGFYKTLSLRTSSEFYLNSSVFISDKQSVKNYTCLSLDGRILDGRSSVTANDGIVLLANAEAIKPKPLGIPSYSDIIEAFGQVRTSAVERDIRFGFVKVHNSYGEQPGFIYGFYDIQQKEFLGKVISYVDIESRGFQNVYIAVCAIDADGNSLNSIDYIGPRIDTTFKPVTLSLKKICPVYSVRYNSDSSIKLGNMNLDLELLKAWPLSISSGSFTKDIYINSNIYTDWKKDFVNQRVRCHYDTGGLVSSSWSKIFGPGHYDIINENPILISNNSIKVRQTPILAWEEPTNRDGSITGVIIPQLKVEVLSGVIVESENGHAEDFDGKVWSEIPFNQIKNYDSQTGIIEFVDKVVPTNYKDIRVSYTIKSKDNFIYEINGEEIPLNPLINKSSLIPNKPLYIYIVPVRIEKLLSIAATFNSYEDIYEYTGLNPIYFTYDNSIFDPTSNLYDPTALQIGSVMYSKNDKDLNIYDTRVRGGGISNDITAEESVLYSKDTLSYWDIYPANGMAYPKGGYVIVKLPKEVKDNFNSVTEIYDIVYKNLTAGVSFEIQDMDGNPFGS